MTRAPQPVSPPLHRKPGHVPGEPRPTPPPNPPPSPLRFGRCQSGFRAAVWRRAGRATSRGGGGGGGTGRSEGDKIGGTGARGGGSGALWQHEPFPPPPPPLPPPSARGRSQRPVSPAPPPPRPGGRLPAALPCSAPPGARCPDVGPFRGRVLPAAATTAAAATAAAPPRRVPRRRGCSMEADGEAEARLLLQEARESIEAARSYRRELEQRLRGAAPGAEAGAGEAGRGCPGCEGWRRCPVLLFSPEAVFLCGNHLRRVRAAAC